MDVRKVRDARPVDRFQRLDNWRITYGVAHAPDGERHCGNVHFDQRWKMLPEVQADRAQLPATDNGADLEAVGNFEALPLGKRHGVYPVEDLGVGSGWSCARAEYQDGTNAGGPFAERRMFATRKCGLHRAKPFRCPARASAAGPQLSKTRLVSLPSAPEPRDLAPADVRDRPDPAFNQVAHLVPGHLDCVA
jgi:hypothetical protein